LQFASLSFDVSVEEIFPTWLRGGCVVVRPDRALDSHRAFLELLERERVTVVNLSTPYWNEVVAEAGRTGVRVTPTLRLAAIGGEKGLPEHFALSRKALAEGARLLNAYGPTETTVTSAAHDFDAENCASASVPLGRPIANTRLYVLDRRQRPVAVGVAAELHIGGHGLARGYLGRPALTAELFVPDPYATEPGARMYRSGAVTRQLPTGEVEFVGRADEQVKVRGFRVELGEIESALAQHPLVRQALVLAREEASGGKRLVAYVVGEAGEQSASELRAYLKGRLPDYMVPSFFVMLDEFPLTANSKVDRRRLPEPGAESAEEYEAPRGEVEELVAGVFSSVLKAERVGRTDNFFDLGGHSLLATQAVSRLREACGAEVALRSLFEHPTVEGLSRVVESALRGEGEGAGAVPPLVAVGREQELPLSFAQQRLWFLDQLEPESAFYNVPTAVQLSGRLDVGVLERTLGEIVARHESLRTVFASVEGRPVQVIQPPRPVRIPLEDLRDRLPSEREAEVARFTYEVAREPFDLSRGPLMRVRLLRLAEDEHVVLLTMHHIVSDGWSMGVMVREISALYRAFAEGRPSPLPPLVIQYADFAVWQREWLRGETLERELDYWRTQLGGELPASELPTDRPRPPVQSYRGAYHSFQFRKETAQALHRLSREEGCTLFMTLLAGFAALLQRYTGQDDIVVGTDIANRNRAEIEPLIGFFINQLVLRTDLSGEPTFVELMRRARDVSLGAYAHQDVPFEKLVEELQPERALGRSPLFQVKLVLQNTPTETALDLPGLRLRRLGGESGASKFDLTVGMVEGG
ncbi:MAG TPA: condensation domain-containing protein, partial [Pyrinomonadaceae bacterium]|nr:condensation domain-containing protein [Pyrinomonadaceae bacterium]